MAAQTFYSDPIAPTNGKKWDGLTKREYFAAKALQGILSAPYTGNWVPEEFAEMAVQMADELVRQLNKE